MHRSSHNNIFIMNFACRIDVIGIYVVMFYVILKTLVRVVLVFMGLFIAFAMALFILMKDEVRMTPFVYYAPYL